MFDYKTPVSSLRYFDNPGVHQADWQKLIGAAIEGGDDDVAFGTEECDTCGKVYVFRNYGGGMTCQEASEQQGDEPEEDDDRNPIPGTVCGGYVSTFEGPMMNSWHRCGEIRYPEDAAKALDGLPLCVVCVDGQYGIALTGGGMDLSWEIVEGFCRLGFVPPAYLRLPMSCDEGYGPRQKFLLGAMKRSLFGEMNSLRNSLRTIKETAAFCQENEKKAAKAGGAKYLRR